MGRIKRGGGDGGEPVRSPPGWSQMISRVPAACRRKARSSWRRAGSNASFAGTPYVQPHNRRSLQLRTMAAPLSEAPTICTLRSSNSAWIQEAGVVGHSASPPQAVVEWLNR